VIVVEDLRAQVETLPGATVTVIEVGDEASRVLTLGDLVGASPGIHIRSAGGTGSFQSLRLRAAAGAEVRVLVDGVPLAQDATGALDLASLPLDQVERVEVYRGVLPVGLAGEGVGGAINLVTRKPDGEKRRTLKLDAGGGSFSTYEASLFYQQARRTWDASAFASARSAQNDFPYYDDNGTPYVTTDDDPDAIRTNADQERADLGLHAVRHGGHGRWRFDADGAARRGGVPGTAALPATDTRYEEGDARAGAHWESPTGRKVRGSAGVAFEGRLYGYQDPEGQVGLGSEDLQSKTGAAWAEGSASVRLPRELGLSGSLRGGRESFVTQDLAQPGSANATRWRDRLEVGLSATGMVGPRRSSRTAESADAIAKPSVRRLDAGVALGLVAARTGSQGRLPWMLAGEEEAGAKPVILISPSGSLAWRLGQGLSTRASLGLSRRLPTLTELYGAEGGLVGNPNLEPEGAFFQDLGVDLAGSLWGGTASLSVTGFHRDVQDLIALVQNSQLTLRAENFGHVDVLGSETELSWTGSVGKLGRADLGLAWTVTHTADYSGDPTSEGRALPGQPLHEARLDGEVGPTKLRFGLTVEVDSGDFRDAANLYELPPRVFEHARVSLQPGRKWPTFTFEVRNILDHRVEYSDDLRLAGSERPAPQAVMDYWGYPLPGRALYLSASWRAAGDAPRASRSSPESRDRPSGSP
jgi:hypothetical protein